MTKRAKLPPPVIAEVQATGLDVVMVDSRAVAAYPWVPRAVPIDSVLVGPDGTTVRVREDGGCEPVLPPGHPHPGPASEPMHTSARGTFQRAFGFAAERSVR